MKKYLFLFFIACLSFLTHASGALPPPGTIIPLQIDWNEPGNDAPGSPKSPPQVPTVSLDGYTLYFSQVYSEVVPVSLADASGTTVFSTVLPIGTTSLVLPSTLSGTYTLYINVGGYLFCGQINL